MKMLLCSVGSNQAEITLRFGAQVAKALSADVTLLGAVDNKGEKKPLAQTLESIAQELTEQGMSVQVLLRAGHAEDIVMREMREDTYDLVAFGALGGFRSRRSFFDSVGMRIIERAQSSVLVIKGDRTRLSRVLICASGVEYGHLSIWAGAALACGAGAQATVLHVADAMPAMYAGLERMEETLAEFLQSSTETSKELRWAAQVVRAECEVSQLKLRRGIVADEILEESQVGDHDVIVLGSSRSAGGLVRVLMGDLTRDIVSRAQRSVLVVRPMG